MTIERVLAEPLVINRIGTQKTRRDRAVELLERVGLNEGMLNRFPNEFSGGQRQRIVVARALALNPKIILCDEPVSALDVSIQAQVLNLLEDLQDEFGFSYLFIAHDLSVVDHISDRIMVMYLGRIVERGGRDDIYQRPTHPYTEALLSSIPVPDPRTRRHGAPLSGGVPDPSSPPQGCHFHPRCAYAVDECKQTDPALEPVPDADDVQAACIRKHELELEGIPPVKSKKRRTKMSELRRRMTESG
jgi:oligopeptide/dipeptide ABC transporter ATP-binding protein